MLREHQDIDMVLSDINMPEMDGLTLLEQIPSVDPNVRSVVVSAYGDMKNIRTAMNRGAFDFVTKPIDFDDLRITITRTLETIELWRSALESRDKLVVLENELSLANRMQQSILPKSFPESDAYQVFASMEAARDVGGDFFDLLPMENDRLGLAVADVSGKGIPAAMFMMSSRTLLRGRRHRPVRSVEDPARSQSAVLCENNDTAMFVTLFLGIFDPATGEFVYANGGHNPPVIFRADGTPSLLADNRRNRAGHLPRYRVPGEFAITLAPGDSAILYSDGVTEAENEAGEQFELDRLYDVFADAPPGDARTATDGRSRGGERVRRRRAPVRRHHLPYATARRRDCVSAELSLQLSAKLDDIAQLHDGLEAFAEQREGWTSKLEFEVKLVVEELFTNVVNYGDCPGEPVQIDLTVRCGPSDHRIGGWRDGRSTRWSILRNPIRHRPSRIGPSAGWAFIWS